MDLSHFNFQDKLQINIHHNIKDIGGGGQTPPPLSKIAPGGLFSRGKHVDPTVDHVTLTPIRTQ